MNERRMARRSFIFESDISGNISAPVADWSEIMLSIDIRWIPFAWLAGSPVQRPRFKSSRFFPRPLRRLPRACSIRLF
jgi:hypothetical protein